MLTICDNNYELGNNSQGSLSKGQLLRSSCSWQPPDGQTHIQAKFPFQHFVLHFSIRHGNVTFVQKNFLEAEDFTKKKYS